mmetsp:Transcript_1044/g.2950  ORF Transcript_1044/g.2950 Transcript_1044/m.2950 type:complete len:392 (+) Transcript_1044:530-1705(+)
MKTGDSSAGRARGVRLLGPRNVLDMETQRVVLALVPKREGRVRAAECPLPVLRSIVLADDALRLHELPRLGRVLLVLVHVGVGVVRLHGGEGVVHVPVVAFVRVHALERVHPLCVVVEVPVALGHLRGGQLGPRCVQARARRLDVGDDVVVGLAGRLLEVAHEPVHCLGLHHVHRHEEGRHAHLRRDAEGARDGARLKHLEADEQVHALVLSLLKEGADPPIVLLEEAEGAEVTEASGDKAGHAGERLEDDEAPLDRLRCRVLGAVARDKVEGVVKAPVHDLVHHVVRKCLGDMHIVVALEPMLQLLGGPDVVLLASHAVRHVTLREIVGRLAQDLRLGIGRVCARDRAEVLGRERAVVNRLVGGGAQEAPAGASNAAKGRRVGGAAPARG